MFDKRQFILFLTQAYPDFEGSHRGIFIRNLVDDLVSHGYRLVVVTPRIFKKSLKKERNAHVFIDRFYFPSGERPLISFKKIPIFLMLIYMVSCLVETFQAMARHSCQLIHVHWIHPNGFIGFIVKLVFRKPLIIHVRGSDFNLFAGRNRFFRVLTYMILRQADRILCTSENARTGLLHTFPKLDPGKIVVVYNKIDSSRFHPTPEKEAREKLGIQPQGISMLFAGNLFYEKGIDVLVEVINTLSEELADKNFFLYVVGEGPLEGMLKKQSHLNPKIHIVGPVRPERMPVWYNASNLLILPSEREGTPNVVLEALHCGIPVLTTNAGDAAKFVKNGENGFVIPVKEKKEALYAVLSNILRRPEDLSAMKGRLQREIGNVEWPETISVSEIYHTLLGHVK